jgi:hypothetical protein
MVERSASNTVRLALLIDGDNAESSLVMQYVEEAGRFVIRRSYCEIDNKPNYS